MNNKLSVSFEFFPPSSPKATELLWDSVGVLAPLRPEFVSVTYGAGGTTRERTHQTIEKIIQSTDLNPAAHLTCVGAPKADIDEIVSDYYQMGVRHIVALRGDPPAGVGTKYETHPYGYQSSIELVRAIKKPFPDMQVTVSAYPEKHPESPDWDTEIDFLKRKIDAGATQAITQFFFYNDHFEAYLDRVRSAGITIPIIPGIVAITNFEQTKRFALKTGALIPASLERRFAGLQTEPDTSKLIGMVCATEQVDDLRRRGIDKFHFYTMNRADMVYGLCHHLGIRA